MSDPKIDKIFEDHQAEMNRIIDEVLEKHKVRVSSVVNRAFSIFILVCLVLSVICFMGVFLLR